MKNKIILFSINTIILTITFLNINCHYANDEPSSPTIPKEALAEDVSNPNHVVGTGTPESCTAEAFIQAASKGGTIVFDSGNQPVTITLKEPAKIFNNTGPKIVIDGGGLVTLSGGGTTRILYMNTLDKNQVITTSHPQNQDHPYLVVQNLTFINGNSTSETENVGGGAIWVRGGRFKIVNCNFINNTCVSTGADVGGGAVYVSLLFKEKPVYILNSSFKNNKASNGGAIGSIGATWSIYNSQFISNEATGKGGNLPHPGTPGGGCGGAIYNDGNFMVLTLFNTQIESNKTNTHGSAIFFVTNDHSGYVKIIDSNIINNIGGFWYTKYKGISTHSDTPIFVTNSIISN